MAVRNARPQPRWQAWLFWGALACAAWLVGTLGSLATSVRAYAIPSSSMSPTLRPGDRVGVDTHPRARPVRGEVWAFHMPGGGAVAVKRVVGLPGETIAVVGGRVLVDGRPLTEPYLAAPASYALPPVVLGPDQYFLLGDNRDASHDSHIWGPLPGDLLIGPVQLRFWPPGRIGGVASRPLAGPLPAPARRPGR